MADALTLLSECIQHQRPISFVTADRIHVTESELLTSARLDVRYICFGTHCFPLATTSIHLECSGFEAVYSILALYLLHARRDASYRDYFQDCRNRKIQAVSLVEKKNILSLLDGSTLSPYYNPRNICECIALDQLTGDPDKPQPADTAAGQSLTHAGTCERPVYSRHLPFLSKKSYSHSAAYLKSLREPTPKHARQQGREHSHTRLGLGSSQSSMAVDRPSPVSREPLQMSVPRDSGQTCPIIIVPSVNSTMINMFNVRSFLESDRYVSVESARAQSGKKEGLVTVRRKIRTGDASVPTKTLMYHVVDSILKLRPEDWRRVVAVFVHGVLWQFKNWRYNSPVDLFSHTCGFYLHFDDVPVDPTVRTWNVTVLAVSRTRRHLDIKATMAFWSTLDAWMASKGIEGTSETRQ